MTDLQNLLCRALRAEDPPVGLKLAASEANKLVEIAVCEGVAPLLHTVFSRKAWADVMPQQAGVALRSQAHSQAAYEMLRTNDLRQLYAGLEAAGIRVLLLKGAALAFTHYTSPELRPRVDTDIYIDMADLRRARVALQGLGYETSGPYYKSRQFNCIRRRVAEGVLTYDVHWRINNLPAFARVLPFDTAWIESEEIPELGGFRTLSSVDTLLLSCIHLASNPNHEDSRLIWLYDLHLIVSEMETSSLQKFVSRAVAIGSHSLCLAALEKASACFGTKLPRSETQALQRPSPPASRWRDSALRLMVDDFRELSGLWARIEMIGEYIYPGSDYLMRRYDEHRVSRLPFLYLRYLFGGVSSRVALR